MADNVTSLTGEAFDAEQSAVLAALLRETQAFFGKDFETECEAWAHAPYIRRLGWWTRGGVTDRWGWDEIGGRMQRMMRDYPDRNVSADQFRYENLVIRVSGDLAFATFDQYAPDTGEPDFDMPGLSREARVLERIDGQWRIIYHTYIHQSAEPVRAPMFRVDKDAHVSWMNRSAEQALKADCGIVLRAGRLLARRDQDQQRLRLAIADAAGRDATLDGGRAAIPVLLEGEQSDLVCVCWVLTEGTGSGAVLVSLNNLTFAQDQIDTAAQVFGFSPAQQRLAELIAAGQTLGSAAGLLGISISTARTHLQRIFEKTGARSQVTLMRTLLSVEPPH